MVEIPRFKLLPNCIRNSQAEGRRNRVSDLDLDLSTISDELVIVEGNPEVASIRESEVAGPPSEMVQHRVRAGFGL